MAIFKYNHKLSSLLLRFHIKRYGLLVHVGTIQTSFSRICPNMKLLQLIYDQRRMKYTLNKIVGHFHNLVGRYDTYVSEATCFCSLRCYLTKINVLGVTLPILCFLRIVIFSKRVIKVSDNQDTPILSIQPMMFFFNHAILHLSSLICFLILIV